MDYVRLFHQHDDPTNWERPPGFDDKEASARFLSFTGVLSSVLGMSLRSETGSLIQDASFHSQLFVPVGQGVEACVRFSNFGNMATVSDEQSLDTRLLEVIISL